MNDFRADIQGLRALAVFLVFIFHISSSVLPGGFLGVDIFFVISGYLISGIILNKVEKKSFRFIDFYIGRLKRIVPVYYIVLTVILIIAVIIYLPSDILQLRMNAFWSAIFASNIYFSTLDTYFGASSIENPFLHTWTLSIEMQFYFLLPLLLYFINKRWLPTALIAIIIGFLGYSVWGTYFLDLKSKMYFSLAARIPEFCIGALFAVKQDTFKKIGTSTLNYISGISLVVILVCAFLFSEKSDYPGYLVIIPCLATSFLLINKDSFINRNIFSHKIAVHIGELSYSIYLWHWAVMALWRYYKVNYEFTGVEVVLIVILTYLLSLFTYFTVESYFRKTNNKKFFTLLTALVVVLGVVAVLLPRLNTYFYKIPDKYSRPTFGLKSHSNSFEEVESFGDLSKKSDSILLIGDSHALVYKNILHNLGLVNSFNFRTITNDRYPNIPGLNQKDFSNKDLFVQYSNIVARTNNEIKNAKIIFICSVWFDDQSSLPSALDQFLKNLNASQTVIILPDYPTPDKNPIRINRDFIKNDNSNYEYKIEYKKLPVRIKKVLDQYKNVHVVSIDFKQKLKDIPFNKDTLMYYDKGHLNLYGTEVVSREFDEEFMNSINKILQRH
ncbi:acyltransferase family protein [Chryseobacterium sp. BIGb0232]|uniref:acyltransferase family protein n=1 Tax=Chryseobacterium sp. BIGb0232 TaxID=2940598 RepID=UPI000F4ADE56|nr:acyltransferase family protein [Chryseobacterium sp. BIGb0232]MCS4301646.1 peptidoglycan/LPS O-acetylase OafA/YrhL [Chryseobacterium sp. BIGb0232]ROS19500.1 peptidoglycan/LPS O-acetylase OafA/YrhL [Chryseobacterium nakagawai]